jgi:predicted porin
VTGVLQGSGIAPLKGESLVFDNFSVDARYFATAAFSVSAAYTYTMGRFDTRAGQTRPKWNQVVAQADYAFSKRTDVYLEGVYQRVSGGNGNPAFNATVWTLTPSANGNQVVVALGLRHKF